MATEGVEKPTQQSPAAGASDENKDGSGEGAAAAAARSTARMALKTGAKTGVATSKVAVKVGAKQLAKTGAKQVAKKTGVKLVQKVGVGKLPVKTIAKVADRGATLGDVADSVSVDSVKSEFKTKGATGAFRVLAKGGLEFAKVTGLGIVAWEGYDFLLSKYQTEQQPQPPPIQMHFGAGLLGQIYYPIIECYTMHHRHFYLAP
ncbi:hypothetical protein TL16_g04227 [Triparma laevis f. inornata]|uniref:Uncharacterized protein n=1 Tax=Triparma laevis f. inornata TaxID=1714386 RepID=A0A9W7A8L4_9STRA|nr:hypothetical protein TL16_g04227 [Triparma laevis f. inornata]